MKRRKLYVPNAILFILDPQNKRVQVPTYITGAIYAASETCISMATRAEADGLVTVSLALTRNVTREQIDQKAFTTTIDTPSKRIAIVTSQLDIVLETDVVLETTRVSILADNAVNPRKLHVAILSK